MERMIAEVKYVQYDQSVEYALNDVLSCLRVDPHGVSSHPNSLNVEIRDLSFAGVT